MTYELYQRDEHPFGRSWEEWAALWCRWMLSVPKDTNPSLDETGKNCSINQHEENVWFLTGTFVNLLITKRKCTAVFESQCIRFNFG